MAGTPPSSSWALWADRLSATSKIATALAGLGGILAAVLVWATAFLATQPLVVLYSSAGVLALSSLILLAATSFMLLNGQQTFAIIAGVICIFSAGMSVVIFSSIPKEPSWEMLGVPYETTINGASPLTLIRDELIPPGFPGNVAYNNKLQIHRPAGKLQQEYIVYQSSEFTKNRFPSSAKSRDSNSAIATYIFGRTSTSVPWQKVKSLGFSDVSSELAFKPTGDATQFIVALVLFPLDRETAKLMAEGNSPLSDFVILR